MLQEFTLRTIVPKSGKTGILGKRVLTLEDEFVIEKTQVNETKFAWSSVPKILENEKYIFLFQTELNGCTIPKRVFESESQARKFFNLLSDLRDKAHMTDE